MKYVSPFEYAKLAGVKPQAIYDRIKRGTLPTEELNTPAGKAMQYIDIDKYPPERKKPGATKRL